MSPVLVRLALVAAGAGIVAGASLASAATGPKTLTFTDESGDAAPLRGDITKVTYTTTGTKSGKTYTPKNLVITLETADAIDTSGTTTYEIDSDLFGCDSGFDVYYTPGVEDSEGGGCTNATGATSFSHDGIDGPPVVSGNKIIWTISLKSSKAFKPGSTISGIDAYTGSVDPATGFVGPYLLGFRNDEAQSDKSYKIG